MGGGRFISLAMAIAIVSMIIVACPASAQVPSLSECARVRQQAINLCKGVIFGQSPSVACCSVVRTGHYECACPVMDAKLAALLTVEKASMALNYCGRDVPHHFKCGSLYFP